MSESVFLLKAEELQPREYYDDLKGKNNLPSDFIFKGLLISPSIDNMAQPAMYLNPVFGKPDSQGNGDVIIQQNSPKACPYPPGYGSGS